MKFWQVMTLVDTDQLPVLCRRAEELGFEGMALGDHWITFESQYQHYDYSKDGGVLWYPELYFPEPWVAIGALSQVTTRLKFITSVYVLPMHDPFSAAKAVSTAARFSNNRVILGIGVGWQASEFALVAQSFENRGRRTDEMLDIIAKLMTGETVAHHGAFYDFPPLQMSPGVTQPVPVMVGGRSAPAYRRAARHQGWTGGQHTVEELSAIVATLRAERAALGKTAEPFEIHTNLYDYDADTFAKIADIGVTHVHRSAWLDENGRASRKTLDEKLRDMEQFANKFMK